MGYLAESSSIKHCWDFSNSFWSAPQICFFGCVSAEKQQQNILLLRGAGCSAGNTEALRSIWEPNQWFSVEMLPASRKWGVSTPCEHRTGEQTGAGYNSWSLGEVKANPRCQGMHRGGTETPSREKRVSPGWWGTRLNPESYEHNYFYI